MYRRLAALMLEELRAIAATTPDDVAYLTPLAVAGQQPSGLTVATLNYDLSIEQAAARVDMVADTGIEEWLKTGQWGWPERGVRLLKLHGSINWVWRRIEDDGEELPRDVVEVDETGDTRCAPAVVFGHRGKLRAQGPFLSLLAEFESLLTSLDRLVIVGYSFRDDHVNEIVRRWITDSPSRRLLVVDPAWPEGGYWPHRDFRSQLKNNLSAERLEAWREPCSTALSRLVVEDGPS